MINDDDTFSEVANSICGNLPDGWTITITLERDSGDIELTDPNGDDVDFASNHETFFQVLKDAVECAMNGGTDGP